MEFGSPLFDDANWLMAGILVSKLKKVHMDHEVTLEKA